MKNAHFLWAVMLSGGLFLPMTSGPVRASEAAVVTLTPAYLNMLSEEMRTNNAALRAAGSRAEAAEFNIASIRSWEDPTFKLGGTVANPRGPKLNEEGDLSYGIEQPLPLFGKPQAARKVAETEIESIRMEADYQFQARRLELARAMFRLSLTDRTVAVGEQDLQWLDQMISVAEEKYRAGSASQVDVLRMQNERSRRLNQLELDRNERQAGVAMVNRLLNRPPTNDFPRLTLPALYAAVPYSQRLSELSLKHEARLKVMKNDLRVAEAVVEQTRLQRKPQVSVGIEGRQYTGDAGIRSGTFTVGFSIPWFNKGKYRADVDRDEAKRRAVQQEIEDYAVSIPAEVRRLTLAVDGARRTALLYRDEIIPRSEQSLAAAHANWAANRGMFNDVMESRRMLLDGRLQEAKAVAQQYELLSELVLCCGVADLEALHVIEVISK